MSYVTSSASLGRLQDSRAGIDAAISTGYRPRMDWYEALKAWQNRELPAEEAIRIAEVADVWELWELALGAGIEIKLGHRDHIASVVRGHRQIERGESVDIVDLIFEMDLIIAGMTEEELKARLRLKWIPTPDGFDLDDLADYEQFLELSREEQRAFMAALSDKDFELYQSLQISRALYRDPSE